MRSGISLIGRSQFETAKLIIKYIKDLKFSFNDLEICIQKKQITLFNMLIEKNPNQPINFKKLIELAINTDQYEFIKSMIQHGITEKDFDIFTYSIQNYNNKLINFLFSIGQQPNLNNTSTLQALNKLSIIDFSFFISKVDTINNFSVINAIDYLDDEKLVTMINYGADYKHISVYKKQEKEYHRSALTYAIEMKKE
ncbi:hypothetical protein TVAG_262110 [Trichomonas vaginalis G3]|uniref:DUF3447 domain-containing protein n=1 Tax=Trichomonas vaginalis (strain ATCC PRA-98 / G3) TaxID=412133 RepID=A2DUC3_TRIV3|nr:spectrin binding [Trichomonas vaginalis G3]EAY15961.1 hypothetical protein TVAG_262110 [Trichomonas vaginalis G3]KAI5523595.1 spectrin binding [Trichomonas vaginalis G3]|eukprot:XP_001328184.1 hypothetical protein [Trichomonas vaginalis G3]